MYLYCFIFIRFKNDNNIQYPQLPIEPEQERMLPNEVIPSGLRQVISDIQDNFGVKKNQPEEQYVPGFIRKILDMNQNARRREYLRRQNTNSPVRLSDTLGR